MKVSEIMRKAVVVDSNIKVKEAAKIMSEKGIGSLIIFKDNKIKGILTERDVIKNISKSDSNIEKIMSKNVITIKFDSDVEEAVKLLKNNDIKRLPVVKDKKLVGIITITDIIANKSLEIEDDFFIN